MSTFVLKRKTFSEEGMSTSKKVALGTLGTLGTGAALFAGAKIGKLGGAAQMGANRLWGKGGQLLGNQKMVNSARTGYTQGMAKEMGITDKRMMVQMRNNLKTSANNGFGNSAPFKDIKPNTAALPSSPTNLPSIVK